MIAATVPETLAICGLCENALVAEGALCRGCRKQIELDVSVYRGAVVSGERLLALDREAMAARRKAAAEASGATQPWQPIRRGGNMLVVAFVLFMAESAMLTLVWLACEMWKHWK